MSLVQSAPQKAGIDPGITSTVIPDPDISLIYRPDTIQVNVGAHSASRDNQSRLARLNPKGRRNALEQLICRPSHGFLL